jgi:hypothetical protein
MLSRNPLDWRPRGRYLGIVRFRLLGKGVNVRTTDLLSGELHRQAKARAALEGKSLSAWLNEAVAAYLAEKEVPAKAKRGA